MINEKIVIDKYTKNKQSLRSIAEEFKTNHHKIKRILIKSGIEITNKDRVRKPFTEEHKKKISKSNKGRVGIWKGKSMPKKTVFKNMKNHLQWDIDLDFLMQFDDIEKLKVLNKMLSRKRVSSNFDTDRYMKFVIKFYNDKGFNNVYKDWLSENKADYAKPSLDHIIPLSKGGTWELDNLQILSWVENRAKYNFLPEEWKYIKSKYFYE